MDEGNTQRELLLSSVIGPATSLEEAIHSTVRDVLLNAATDPALTRDLALALLKRVDLPAEVLEEISKNQTLHKQRQVKFALASHPRTPRHISVPLVRELYTFDLMRVALSLTAPADIKKTADKALISRLKTITVGERLTLARRASGRIAAALLLDPQPRVMSTALDNPRLTEVSVTEAVLKSEAGCLVQAVSHHPKWSCRRDVQTALLRTEHLSLARALAFERNLQSPVESA